MKSSAIKESVDVSSKDEFEVTIKIDRNKYLVKSENTDGRLKDFNYLARAIVDQLEIAFRKELGFTDSDVNQLGIYTRHTIEGRFRGPRRT